MGTSTRLLAVTLLALGACKPAPTASHKAVGSASAAASVGAAVPSSTSPAPSPVVSAVAAASASSKAPPAPSGPPPAWKGGLTLEPKDADIATGAFVALGAVGAMVRRRDDEVLLVRLADGKPTPIDGDGKIFARTRTLALDHGADTMVYWVSEGKLRRRLINHEMHVGAAEVIADDAEDGFDPHGVRNEGNASVSQDIVAYVARKRSRDGERRARVWVEGKGSRDLSSEGGGASSVWVASLGPGRVGAVWLDARSAQVPLHALAIDLDGAGEPRLGHEGVQWIAPPSDSISAVSVMRVEDTLVALLAVPRNGLDFGLASLPVLFDARPRDEASWLMYPNGLDPAPAVPARFCGQPLAALVRPTDKQPDAPKTVELASVEPSGRVTSRVEVARATRVDHLTAWVSPKGDGWVAWVGDGRTRVRRVKCGK